MKTLELKKLVELNIVNTNVMNETIEVMGVDDLPTKVRANIDGAEVEFPDFDSFQSVPL